MSTDNSDEPVTLPENSDPQQTGWMAIQHLIIKSYLPASSRVIIYSSIAFFSVVVESAVRQFSLTYGQQLFFLANVVIYEVIRILVKRTYRPRFYRATQTQSLLAESQADHKIFLDEKLDELRVKIEIYLKTLLLTHSVYLAMSLYSLVMYLNNDQRGVSFFMAGTAGLVMSFFNFIGVLLLAAEIEPLKASRVVRVLGILLLISAWIYVVAAIVSTNFSLF